jgi:hypothetical protein
MFLTSIPFLFPHLKSLTSDDCVIRGTSNDDVSLERGVAEGRSTVWARAVVTEEEGVGGDGSGGVADGGPLDLECGVAVGTADDGGAQVSECGVTLGTRGSGGGVTDGSRRSISSCVCISVPYVSEGENCG